MVEPKIMETDRPLSDKEQRFITAIAENPEITPVEAYTKAGFAAKSPETARINSLKLVKRDYIVNAIARKVKENATNNSITPNYVLTRIKENIEMCMGREPIVRCDGTVVGYKKHDSMGALKGLELLGKYLKLWTDRIDVTSDGEKINSNVMIINGAKIQF